MEKNIELRFMHWVFVDGIKFFGPGRAELLVHIQDTGSIAKAAKAMEMSYKKAWRMVDEMNAMGKSPYVVAQKGGKQGGGTELTERGKAVLAAYSKLNTKLRAAIEEESELPGLI
ncbi:winged helix-turn-helix domain-containing protein [Dyadobacter psychrophilus]|uniref:Molybdate transport system regulatory protein n=1 Tax=Dyadobacter psychrophilus TaxID=651661 RepID=A0A1T5DIK6_9BACT|nr:LysR family transcriptional regulator [Dyadobacter psychrophilus]SKB71401.1 molybdate transport system regulatory protein [Dyadobacter psychrophilus]